MLQIMNILLRYIDKYILIIIVYLYACDVIFLSHILICALLYYTCVFMYWAHTETQVYKNNICYMICIHAMPMS